ncbi:MAG: helix-turn-helix transcriptional regulator [Chloroflexota bacterium]
MIMLNILTHLTGGFFMDEPIAKSRHRTLRTPYDPEPLKKRVLGLLDQRNETYREASLSSGLDHQAIRRILAGRRPDMHICILFADHFGVNPNEFLQLAGWPTLKAFDIHSASAENLPPEAVDVAMDIARIPDPGTRKQVAEAIRTLLAKYFEA